MALIAIALAAGLLAPTIAAETVSANGTAGARGANGMDGTPATDGSPGESAESVTAVADAPLEDNSATARGGTGGSGGQGGRSLGPGGNGGNGGDGGDATATATTTGGFVATASATGGGGGSVGFAGSGFGDGLPGEVGGVGGSAEAISTTNRSFLPGEGASVRANAYATGGQGGRSLSPLAESGGGGGGDARAIARVEIRGSGSASAFHVANATVTGGPGDGSEDGGEAESQAMGTSPFGTLSIISRATGGRAPSDDRLGTGGGGAATATALGTHSGSGELRVEARASVVDDGPDRGDAIATASGIATNGADVRVISISGGGTGLDVRDTVSGSTSGSLVLEQSVFGGAANTAELGRASTSLTAGNAGGGDLTAIVSAIGGIGKGGEGLGGIGRIDSVVATGEADVVVRGVASGGEGRRDRFSESVGNGGTAEIGSLFGRSTGNARVAVEARLTGGEGGRVLRRGDQTSGGDSIAIDLVDGETTSELTLSQFAIGGTGDEGTDGRAISRLTRSHTVEVLTIRSEATGSRAEAYAEAINAGGEAVVEAVAIGRGRSSTESLEGAEAISEARGTTIGDGHAVRVGDESLVNATGGMGGFSDSGVPAQGGAASSLSVGEARGDSAVFVSDRSEGGRGGSGRQRHFPLGVGGRGGDAVSRAEGRNAGASDVEVVSRARGGQGGAGSGAGNSSGTGGSASVSARGESTGGASVLVHGQASGGDGGYKGLSIEGDFAGRGGDASITNLSGGTSGLLTLQADVVGGFGGKETILTNSTRSGRGGDAHAELVAVNEGGGDLVIDVSARATTGGRVTLGEIRGSSENGADVTVNVDVSVNGARFGEDAPDDVEISDSIELVNVVDGMTTGRLTLEQSVFGGGANGLVRNEIEKTGDFEALSLSTDVSAIRGANAISHIRGVNNAGSATGEASATSSLGTLALATSNVVGAGDEETRSVATSLLSSGMEAGRSESIADARSTGGGRVEASASAETLYGESASASAIGGNAGAGEVLVEAIAESTILGARTLSAVAEGSSTGGGDVRVLASMLRTDDREGGTVELRDAVSGSTSGLLTLRQSLTAIRGDVTTSLEAENGGGGDLVIEIDARAIRRPGTSPFDPGTSGGDVVLGNVAGHSGTGAAVQIDVRAMGNEIRREPSSGANSSSVIEAVSQGGPVTVSADFRLNSHYELISTGPDTRAASGRAISMDNVVDGQTSGSLSLRQVATAGRGEGLAGTSSTPDVGFGFAGDGGEAESRIDRIGTFTSLELEADARGGEGGAIFGGGTGSEGGNGGNAISSIVAKNNGGDAIVHGSAQGGFGGNATGRSGRGGDASVEHFAESFGDGHSVFVGREPGTDRFRRLEGAVGGAGSSFQSTSNLADTIMGRGGHAVSHSEGRAHGNGEVVVLDRAVGGSGQNGGFFTPIGHGGDGGNASSTARAIGGGDSLVSASAYAAGGRGGSRLLSGGSGGDAEANARAVGRGTANAIAQAIGGAHGIETGRLAAARATSFASGTSGLAEAIAETGSSLDLVLAASVSRDVRSGTRVEAFVGRPSESSSTKPADTSAFVVGSPLDQEIDDATAMHGGLSDFLAHRAGSQIRATGGLVATGFDDGTATQHVELDISLNPPPQGGELFLAVFKLDAIGGGFEQLGFRLEVKGEVLGQEIVFERLVDARAYFASMIELGDAFAESPRRSDSPPALRAIFDIRSGKGQRLSLGLAAVVVPEPGTAVLVSVGLMVLARRRHTPRF